MIIRFAFLRSAGLGQGLERKDVRFNSRGYERLELGWEGKEILFNPRGY